MPRGVSLLQLVEDTQHEAHMSALPSVGIQFRETVKYQIRKAQEFYNLDYRWEHLCGTAENGMFEVLTAAGERVYDLPTDMEPSSIRNVFYNWGGVWTKLTRGIRPEDYSAQDSDDVTVTSEPALRWDLRSDNQFEIWPRPGTNDMQIRFDGRKILPPLVADDDVCVIESYILVLRAASKLLARKDPKEAKAKEEEAKDIYYKLRHGDTIGVKAHLNGTPASEETPRDPSERIIAVNRE